MGYSKVFYLGSGTSFDIKTLTGLSDEECQQLTISNFIIETSGGTTSFSAGSTCSAGNHSYADYVSNGTTSTSLSITKNYDSTTGVLNAYGTLNVSTVRTGGKSSLWQGSNSITINCIVYLIF